MKIAVCGTRTNEDYGWMIETMNALLREHPTATLITGDAKGTDAMARIYAKNRGIDCEVYQADWGKLGKSAGPERNCRMLKQAQMLVAYWDGKSKGTAHAIKEANRRGLPTVIVTPRG